MMNPSVFIPLILGLPTFASLIFFLGLNIGGYNGMSVGRTQGIVYCMEHPEKCNVEYQYIKLKQGDQK